jgi:hypothetical protein
MLRVPPLLSRAATARLTYQHPRSAAAVAVAKGMAQKALAASPNPQWTEYEMQSVDEWIARQDVKLDRSEAIRRLVELGLKAKK